MRLPFPDSPTLRLRLHLSLLLGVTAAANTLTAAFVIFTLLSRGAGPEGAVGFVALVMTGALLSLTAIGRTRIGRLGARAGLVHGSAWLMGFYVSVMLLDSAPAVAVPLCALTFGGYIAFFFVPFNAAALGLTSDGDRATTLGAFGLVFPAVATLMPIIGGTVIARVSLGAAAAVSFALVALSLAFVAARARLAPIAPVRLDAGTVRCIRPKAALGLWSQGLFDGAVWAGLPIIGFLIFKSASEYGAFLSVVSLSGAVAAVAMGRASDRARERLVYFYAGVVLLFPGVIVGLSVAGALGFTVSLAMINLAVPIIGTFLFAMAGDSAASRPADLAFWREILLNSGRLVGAVALIPLALLFGWYAAPFLVMLVGSCGMAAGRVAVNLREQPDVAHVPARPEAAQPR